MGLRLSLTLFIFLMGLTGFTAAAATGHAIQNPDRHKPALTSGSLQVAQTDNAQPPSACKGIEMYGNWVVSWSQKKAVVFVRKPAFLDPGKSAGKKLRFAFRVGGKVDPTKGRDDLFYALQITAQENGSPFIPRKQSLSVDDTEVQKWGPGGGQWTALTNQAMQALFAGQVAIMDTQELGQFRFPLKGLDPALRYADLRQQKAVTLTKLGRCS